MGAGKDTHSKVQAKEPTFMWYHTLLNLYIVSFYGHILVVVWIPDEEGPSVILCHLISFIR